jgi:hypothetical protein
MELQLGNHSLIGEMDSILISQRTRPHDAALPFDILLEIYMSFRGDRKTPRLHCYRTIALNTYPCTQG